MVMKHNYIYFVDAPKIGTDVNFGINSLNLISCIVQYMKDGQDLFKFCVVFTYIQVLDHGGQSLESLHELYVKVN